MSGDSPEGSNKMPSLKSSYKTRFAWTIYGLGDLDLRTRFTQAKAPTQQGAAQAQGPGDAGRLVQEVAGV